MLYSPQEIIIDEYIIHYNKLSEYINNGKLIAFLGAGLSADHKYKTWEELILGKDEKSLVNKSKLMNWENIKDSDGDYDLLVIADECYKKIGQDEWDNYIYDIYDNVADIHIDVDEPYVKLFKTKIFSYITTNFDGCAYKAISALNLPYKIAIYPSFPGNLFIRDKYFCYLHGIGFKTEHRDRPCIILTSSQYKDAYEDSVLIPPIFRKLIDFNLLFLGFSMKDKFVKKMMEKLNKSKLLLIENDRNAAIELPKISKFIVLPYWPSNTRDDKFSIEQIKIEDDSLLQYDIQVIRYKASGPYDFSNFVNLINLIHQETPNPEFNKKPHIAGHYE